MQGLFCVCRKRPVFAMRKEGRTSETIVDSCYLQLRLEGTLSRLPTLSWRKEMATVGQYAPNLLGHTWPTMVETMGCNPERGS